jgi:hypothetical protein
MTTKANRRPQKKGLTKPEPFDLMKAREAVLKTIEDNKAWVKEMAKK